MSSTREPQTHDYTNRYFGHDYVFDPIGDGRSARSTGWGIGIEVGDFIIMSVDHPAPGQNPTTRYRFDDIEYYDDPGDMWSAVLSFAPRVTREEWERCRTE